MTSAQARIMIVTTAVSVPSSRPLMELLAIRLGRQKTPAKSMVIPEGEGDEVSLTRRSR
jgi:hypothetical protein